MCLRIYLNGDGTGRGSHLSLFFVVMRGQSDALLKWPFNQKVKQLDAASLRHFSYAHLDTSFSISREVYLHFTQNMRQTDPFMHPLHQFPPPLCVFWQVYGCKPNIAVPSETVGGSVEHSAQLKDNCEDSVLRFGVAKHTCNVRRHPYSAATTTTTDGVAVPR